MKCYKNFDAILLVFPISQLSCEWIEINFRKLICCSHDYESVFSSTYDSYKIHESFWSCVGQIFYIILIITLSRFPASLLSGPSSHRRQRIQHQICLTRSAKRCPLRPISQVGSSWIYPLVTKARVSVETQTRISQAIFRRALIFHGFPESLMAVISNDTIRSLTGSLKNVNYICTFVDCSDIASCSSTPCAAFVPDNGGTSCRT